MSSSAEAIRTLEPGSHVAEMEVKKSRFIGYAKNVDNWEDAKAYIDAIKEEPQSKTLVLWLPMRI